MAEDEVHRATTAATTATAAAVADAAAAEFEYHGRAFQIRFVRARSACGRTVLEVSELRVNEGDQPASRSGVRRAVAVDVGDSTPRT